MHGAASSEIIYNDKVPPQVPYSLYLVVCFGLFFLLSESF